MYELCGLLGQHHLGFFHNLHKLLEILFNKHIFKDREQLLGVLYIY